MRARRGDGWHAKRVGEVRREEARAEMCSQVPENDMGPVGLPGPMQSCQLCLPLCVFAGDHGTIGWPDGSAVGTQSFDRGAGARRVLAASVDIGVTLTLETAART